jgi:hypothetical protein
LIAVLSLVTSISRAQSFNVYEGLGVLENGWEDWSWCTRNFKSTAYVFEGTYSTEVDYTGAWQGFYLNSGASFPATYFSALSFMINGGTTSGRTINVSLTVNGNTSSSVNLNSFIAGGSVVANKWSKVSIPLSAFGVKTTDSISQILLQEGSGQAQAAFYIGQIGWTPNIPSSTVALSVNTTKHLRTVDPKLFGVNTAVWDPDLASAECKTLIRNGEYKAFRFPGGSLSDTYNWKTNTTGSNTWQWAVNFDTFASVAVPQTQGQCFITANYGTGTPAEAAAWVKYSNVTKKYGFKYWEVGNEVYGTWETDSHALPNDPVTYANQFAQYYTAMKAVDPTIKIGAVASAGEDSYVNYKNEVVTNPRTTVKHSGWTPVMLSTLASLHVTPDFIIYHRYPEYDVDCDFTLLTGNSGWVSDFADLRQQLQDYLGTANTKTQIMCTENNADAGTAGKQLCSLVNAIYIADSFGTILQTEANSYMFWDLFNGQQTNPADGPWLYGWRPYGDEGMISADLTQLYPSYYAEQMLNRFAAAGDTVVSGTSSYGLLTVYATQRSNGTVRVMVVNKNAVAALPANLTFTGFTPKGNATEYFYGIPQDAAASKGQSQAIEMTTLSHLSLASPLSFPPYSITVLVFSPS